MALWRLVGTRGERWALNSTPEVLTIEAIVAGGDGLARAADGRVVFVPRTVPGERVEVEYSEEHRQWARGRLVRIVEPGPGRREPPCPYYAVCGGCQLQHLEYATQRESKASIITDTLRRLGGIVLPAPEVVPSALELGYRNRITLLLRRAGSRVAAGYHAFPDPSGLIDIDACPLAEPAINRAWVSLRSTWGPLAQRLPSGGELRLTLRATAAGEVGLAVEGGEGDGEPDDLLEAVDGLESIWRLGRKGEADWYVGKATLADDWGDYTLRVAGTTFIQVNRSVAAKLEAYVREEIGEPRGMHVVDVYCGFGHRALRLAWAGAHVVGIDSDRHAIAMADAAAAESGAPARFVAAPAGRALARELSSQLVILNPPRRGIEKEVVESLLRTPPGRIIYVSCDPATLARDLKALSGTFGITACRAFDMFPQTAQVESVVTLDRS
ncbi:MAG: class I SAM-dependent RNA methyltransferase [Gemmatimonadales bacterium]